VADRGAGLLERAHRRRRAALGVPLERFTAGLHEDDDEPCQRLIERHRSDNGERRHDVGRKTPFQRVANRLKDDRRPEENDAEGPNVVVYRSNHDGDQGEYWNNQARVHLAFVGLRSLVSGLR
jgi:hypothetical protein